MKKTLIAVAALAATASFAQVTIYGRAHVALDSQQGTGGVVANSDIKSRTRVADDGSRFGLRVNEDLGGGLRAFTVIETGVNLDTATATGQNTSANSGTGFFGTREAHVGIGNKMAEVRLGRQNVFWSNGSIEDTSANQIHGGVISTYTAPSSGWLSAPAARMDNTVVIVGNDLGAFNGSNVWYSVGAAGASEAAAANLNAHSKAKGITVQYGQGPLAVKFDYGVNTAVAASANDAAYATTDTEAKGTKLGVAYTYAPGSKVALIAFKFEREYLDATTNGTALAVSSAGAASIVGARSQSGTAIGLNHNLGGGLQGIAQYVTQGDVSGLANSGSKAYALGIRKDLSKMTSVSASYNVIKNEAANMINATGGGQNSATFTAGQDLKAFGVGLQVNF